MVRLNEAIIEGLRCACCLECPPNSAIFIDCQGGVTRELEDKSGLHWAPTHPLALLGDSLGDGGGCLFTNRFYQEPTEEIGCPL